MQPVPSVGIADAPKYTICINEEWWSTVSGQILTLAYPDFWDGTDAEKALAADQIYKLLNVGLPSEECGQMAYPTTAHLWHHESVVLVGDPMQTFSPATAPFGKTDHYFNMASYQPSLALGDTFKQDFLLAAGDYDFTVLGLYNSVHGYVSWYLDGVEIIHGQDWYDSSVVQNRLDIEEINVPTSGLHELKGVIIGKRPASAAYGLALTAYWWKPTA